MARVEDAVKKRQSQVSKEGSAKEKEVIDILLGDEDIRNKAFVGKPSDVLSDKDLLNIDYGSIKETIDADICVVRKKDNKLVCVISVKKSFRERGGQTAYWAVKVKDARKDYKYILATPDKDKELYNPDEPEKERKWRVILAYECDAVFVYSYPGQRYKNGNFYVGKECLIEYIKGLL